MSEWEIIRHQVAIAGRVTDVQTGQAIGGAEVRITAAPPAFTDWLAARTKQYGAGWAAMDERPDQTRTVADGHFHFLDLPDGQYTLAVKLPGAGSRYGTAQASATVARDAQGRIKIAVADITLRPTTIRGLITGQGAAPIVMAEVRVKGSGERAFTNAQGRYALTGLEVGPRTVLFSARGYQPASANVSLDAAGAEQVVNYTLVP